MSTLPKPIDSAVSAVLALLAASDAMDAELVADSFDPDGVLRFGNNPEVAGAERVRRAFESFFKPLAGLSHDVLGVTTGEWDRGTVVSVESEVTYLFPGGARVGPLPVTTSVRLTPEHKAARYQIYIDPSPIAASVASSRAEVSR